MCQPPSTRRNVKQCPKLLTPTCATTPDSLYSWPPHSSVSLKPTGLEFTRSMPVRRSITVRFRCSTRHSWLEKDWQFSNASPQQDLRLHPCSGALQACSLPFCQLFSASGDRYSQIKLQLLLVLIPQMLQLIQRLKLQPKCLCLQRTVLPILPQRLLLLPKYPKLTIYTAVAVDRLEAFDLGQTLLDSGEVDLQAEHGEHLGSCQQHPFAARAEDGHCQFALQWHPGSLFLGFGKGQSSSQPQMQRLECLYEQHHELVGVLLLKIEKMFVFLSQGPYQVPCRNHSAALGGQFVKQQIQLPNDLRLVRGQRVTIRLEGECLDVSRENLG